MGLKRNFIFSSILTGANYIFPFLVYPYVSRVLGPENIGICNLVDSIVNYAVYLSMMGVTLVGVREVAKAKVRAADFPARRNPELNRAFTSMVALCLIFTVVASSSLIAVTYCVDKYAAYRPLMLVGQLKLWGNFLLLEWLYRGLEDFRFITVRTIIVRTLFVVSVFVFVRKAQDYTIYFLLMMLVVALNAVINCIYATRIVRFRFDLRYTLAQLRPFVIFGVYTLLSTLYVSVFNNIYLESVCGATQLGYYSTATKIFNIILALYTAYSTVVIPRASAMLQQGQHDEFKVLIGKSVDALMLIAIPIVFAGTAFSSGIIYLIAGEEYTGAIHPMMVLMPLIFVIGYEQILVLQVLTPLGRDKYILFNSIIGVSVGLLMNILLVRVLAATGSAIVWACSEISVLLLAQWFVKRTIGIGFPVAKLLRYLAAYLPFGVAAAVAVRYMPVAPIPMMLCGGAAVLVYTAVVQHYWLHNPIYASLAATARKIIGKRHGRR